MNGWNQGHQGSADALDGVIMFPQCPTLCGLLLFWRTPLFVNLASSSMMIDCWPQKKWRDSCCSIFSIMGVRSGSVRYKRQKRLIWRKVAFCVARKLARSDFGGQEGRSLPFYHSASTLLMPSSSWSSTLLLRTLLSDGKLRQRRLEMAATKSINSRIRIKKSVFPERGSPMISDIVQLKLHSLHFLFSFLTSEWVTRWVQLSCPLADCVIPKGGRLRRNGDKNISKRLPIPNFWSCSLVDCVLGRWSPEGQWRGKLSPISQRGCSPAATEWCEEEKRKRNSHFLYRKKQFLKTGSQFRKCMRGHVRSACITWN